MYQNTFDANHPKLLANAIGSLGNCLRYLGQYEKAKTCTVTREHCQLKMALIYDVQLQMSIKKRDVNTS
jgi:hypothetical protein